jgi:hypothetical protein
MKKCCCMNKPETACQMKMNKTCNRDFKDAPQKPDEKRLLMQLNVLPKNNDLYSTSTEYYLNNSILNTFNNSLPKIPINSQGVYITLSNLRI